MVTVDDSEVVDLETVPCDVVRWAVLSVHLRATDNIGNVIDRIGDKLESAVAKDADGRLLACRIVLEGRTEVHSQLVTSEDQILAEARASALGLGDEVAWVEKVVISTEPPVDAQTLAQREDAVGELERLLKDAKYDQELLALIEADIGALIRRLPHEVRSEIDDHLLKLAIGGEYPQLITEITPYLSAHLIAGES